MWKRLKIWWLRRRATYHLNAYYSAYEPYDCGFRLAEYTSPRMVKHKLAFNATLDKLALLEESTPAARL